MTSKTTDTLKQIRDDLKKSPLFQLSLASKELFHSNFLAWLCETYPDSAGQLFAPFAPLNYERLQVYRERKNIDLWLEYSCGETLIIENKVKSLPALQQLKEYADEFRTQPKTTFLLLSLTRPSFLPLHETKIALPKDKDSVVWHYLTYRELADRLKKIEEVNSYHGQLIDDYITFITLLDKLQACFIIEDWADENSNFFREDIELLKDIRLHDVFDKIRYAQLAQRVSDELKKEWRDDAGEIIILSDKTQWPDEAGKINISSGMTRGVGLFDLKYCLMDKERCGAPVILGVQVQGNDFRLVVEINDNHIAPKIADAIADALLQNKVWFNFDILPSTSEEYPKKSPTKNRSFNQYDGKFLYRSKRLGSISPRHLVDAIKTYARLIREKADVLRHQIEVVL